MFHVGRKKESVGNICQTLTMGHNSVNRLNIHFQWVNNLICKLLLLFSCLVMSDSFASPQTVVCLAPLSMGLPRQEYWSGLLFSSPRDLPYPGTQPVSPELAGIIFTTEPAGKFFTEVVGL